MWSPNIKNFEKKKKNLFHSFFTGWMLSEWVTQGSWFKKCYETLRITWAEPRWIEVQDKNQSRYSPYGRVEANAEEKRNGWTCEPGSGPNPVKFPRTLTSFGSQIKGTDLNDWGTHGGIVFRDR